MLLKEVPYYERPREKLLHDGVSSLSNTELLAILIATGTKNKNVLEVSKSVLYLLEDITDLSSITVNELTEIEGVGKVKAVTILAAVELGKRMATFKKDNISFNSSNSIYEYFYPKCKYLKEEVFYVVYLDIKNNVISIKELSNGGTNMTLIDPKTIFKWAFKLTASKIILVHNHPSGDSTPSNADLMCTQEVIKMGSSLKIEVLDHIIIGSFYTSLRKENATYHLFK